VDVPDGLSVEPAGPLAYELAPRGHVGWDLTVRMLPDAGPACRFIAARTVDPAGQLLEDAAVITAGESAARPAGLSLEEAIQLAEAEQQALAAEADLLLLTPRLAVPPGGCGEISAALANRTGSALRGEAQLVSPVGSWHELQPRTQGFCAEPGRQVILTFQAAVPAAARPGQCWWALVKVMYFGRLRYSAPAEVTVQG
jgi:hypothetical protein